jgi:hypothetical protein
MKKLGISLISVATCVLTAASASPGRSPRIVSPALPWHQANLDGQGRIRAWYRPGRNLGYDRVLRVGWDFLERGVPTDRRAGVKTYLAYAVFDGRSGQGTYWQHNPAFLNSSLVDSLVAWYPYSGDRRAIRLVRSMLDYQLARGATPGAWRWSRVPFSTSCAGDRAFGRCLAGAPPRFYGGVEPDKVGLLGLSYARFYELTGERRYLTAAIHAGDALSQNVRTGDAEHTPWPFRVDGRTGAVVGGAQYGGAIVGPVGLLDELVRLGVGNVSAYRRTREIAWRWLTNHPLNPDSRAFNRWSGFYEDVPYNPGSRDQVSATLTARYLLEHEAEPAKARALLDWTRSTFGRGPFFGAWGIDEQRAPGKPGCCSAVGLGSDTSRWAATEALLFARTGDEAARDAAVRSLSYATYFARSDGRVSCCGLRRHNTYWFSDGYGDYLRSFSWAMAAIPELAPRRQDHLLGSTSVVQAVTYRSGEVRYRTFDRGGTETLRLSYRPAHVFADGRPLPLGAPVNGEAFTFRKLAGGDFVALVTRERSRRIRVAGLGSAGLRNP